MKPWRKVALVALPLLIPCILDGGKTDAFHIRRVPSGMRTGCTAVTSSKATNKTDIRNDDESPPTTTNRRSCLKIAASLATTTIHALATTPTKAHAEITQDSQWPLWPALPVAPYSRRRTIRREIVPGSVWTFDQVIGIYYVFVPIRMTVTASTSLGGLVVYAPVAPTKECLDLLQELIDVHGPIKFIILPTVAVEHKVNAGPFARHFPNAAFYVTDRQYSFPIGLPGAFLGFPSWTKPLPMSSSENDNSRLLGPDFSWEVVTVKPGPGSMYQDVALLHKSSKTLMICDALFATTAEPPTILTEEPEYTRALLFHARDAKDDMVPDTPENRRKGWRRIVLLFNFFFPGSGKADLGLGPIVQALQTPTYPYGWGGWKPFSWNDEASEVLDFETYSANGKPTLYTIVQIILSRDSTAVTNWIEKVSQWDFVRVIPAHLDAPLSVGPAQFRETYDFLRRVPSGGNQVRYCDEDVAFLRKAEEGFLSFSVYKSKFGALRGQNGDCRLVK